MRLAIAIISAGLLATYAHPHKYHWGEQLVASSTDGQPSLKFEDRSTDAMDWGSTSKGENNFLF